MSLPLNKKIIFSGAVSFEEKRKGFDQLVKALEILKKDLYTKENIHLAIAGNSNIEFEKLLPFPYTMLGYLSHTDLPKAFQAADVFVSPSIEDAGPMMVNQSIMCGTPVVAFEIGVALDLVHNGDTGYRAKLEDCDDLANGIYSILKKNQEELRIMQKNCRKLGINKFSIKKISNFFESLI